MLMVKMEILYVKDGTKQWASGFHNGKIL